MRYTLTMREEHFDETLAAVKGVEGVEGAAYLLCRVSAIGPDPWTRAPERRFLVREVIAIREGDIESRDATHITWRTEAIVRLFARCEREDIALVIVHSHPAGYDDFSKQDAENERRIFQYGFAKCGESAIFGSVLLTSEGALRGQVWTDHAKSAEPMQTIRVLGKRYRFFQRDDHGAVVREAFRRQALALGDALDTMLSHLRIGIIGCGGTGSAAATLLARLGAGHLALIDDDIVEITNLNRLHGASQSDADLGFPKAQALANAISEMALGCSVRAFVEHVGSKSVRDALRACDLVFNCTDDNAGRIVVNRLAYFYLIPVIDMGLTIQPHRDEAAMRHMVARVTVVFPTAPCLLCRKVIDPEMAAAESLRRAQPAEYERRKAEAYVVGAGDPNPAVVTFTTETAAMAINEVLQRLTQFRGAGEEANQRYRDFIAMEDGRRGVGTQAGCRVCSRTKLWGFGDAEPFLELAL